uniref:Uncharacterized protein n=1 Tax=Branchiostoma floridae TaxID=7739 RepID=C3YXE5_BRAFL|eukprot:XP_002599151.1 hypothetical protein BRAFLDRAFT_81818 [Branchiostoma floridae]
MIREKTARGLWQSYRVVERSDARNLAAAPSTENVSSLKLRRTTVIATVCDIDDDDNGSQGEPEYITLVISEEVQGQRLSENGGETPQSQGHGSPILEGHPTSADMVAADELWTGQITETGVNVNIADQRAIFMKTRIDETGNKATTDDGMNSGQTNSRQLNSEVSVTSNMQAFAKTPQANTTIIGGGDNGGLTCSTKSEHASDTLAVRTHESDRGQSAGGHTPAVESGTYRGHETVTAVLQNDHRLTPLSVADSMYEGHVSKTGLHANTDKRNDTFEIDNNNLQQEGKDSDQSCSPEQHLQAHCPVKMSPIDIYNNCSIIEEAQIL